MCYSRPTLLEDIYCPPGFIWSPMPFSLSPTAVCLLMTQPDPEAPPQHRQKWWRVVRMYRNIDEFYSAPNLPMPRPIHPRAETNIEEAEAPVVDGLVRVRQLEPYVHAPKLLRWQCERRYRTIEELYNAPNFTMPRPARPMTKANEPPVSVIPTNNATQGYQLSQLNTKFMAMQLGQSSTRRPKEVLRGMSAPSSMTFPTQEELYDAPHVPSPTPLSPMPELNEFLVHDARSFESQLVQEPDLLVTENVIDGEVRHVLEPTYLDTEDFEGHILQESSAVEENRQEEEVHNYPNHTKAIGSDVLMDEVQQSPMIEQNNMELIVPDDVERENVLDMDSASDIVCCQCLCGDKEEELVLCDSCTLGYHTFCARPILPCVPIGPWKCSQCSGPRQVSSLSEQDIINFFKIQHFNSGKKRKRGMSTNPWSHKNRKQWRPYVPSKEKSKRLEQLGSLARALLSFKLEFANDLVYVPDIDDPRSTNQATLDKSEVQILQKGNAEIWKLCKAMHRRGESPPLNVIYDKEQGYMVVADETIEDKTFLCEFTGLVDFSKNRELDDSNCLMNLLQTNDEYKDLVICQDKYGNVSHFVSGINNHKRESKRKQNCTFIRCCVDGQCHIFLVSIRRIKAGTALYCNYNAGVSVNTYPTQNFV